jgi:hypothetical protein
LAGSESVKYTESPERALDLLFGVELLRDFDDLDVLPELMDDVLLLEELEDANADDEDPLNGGESPGDRLESLSLSSESDII